MNTKPVIDAVNRLWERFRSCRNGEVTEVISEVSRVLSLMLVAELNLTLRTVEKRGEQ